MLEAYRVGVSLVQNQGIFTELSKLIEQYEALDRVIKQANASASALSGVIKAMPGFGTAMGNAATAAASMGQAAANMAQTMPNVARQAEATASAMERAAGAGQRLLAGPQPMLALPPPNYAQTEFPSRSSYQPDAWPPLPGYTRIPGGPGGVGPDSAGSGQAPGTGAIGPAVNLGPTLNVPPGITMPGAGVFTPGAGRAIGQLIKGSYLYELTIGTLRDLVGIVNKPFEQYEKLNTEETRLRMAGVSDPDIKQLEETVWRITKSVPGVKAEDAMSGAIAMRAVIGEEAGPDKFSAIRRLLPIAEQAAVVLRAATGETSPEALARLYKSVELRGDVVDPKTHEISPERFAAGMDAALNVLLLGHGLIKTNDLYNLTKQAGGAIRTVEDPYAAWSSVMTPTLELGGSRTGTGLTAAFRALLGGSMAKHFADELVLMGLTTPGAAYKKLMPIAGEQGAVIFNKGFLKDEDVLVEKGLQAWLETVVREKYAGLGITSAQDINKETYRMMNTETYRRLAAIYLTQGAQVQRDMLLFKQVPGLGQKLDTLQENSLAFGSENLDAAWSNRLTGFGESLSWLKQTAVTGANWLMGAPTGIKVPWWMSPNPSDWFGDRSRVAPWWAATPGVGDHSSYAPIGNGETLRLDPSQQIHVIVDNGRDLAAGTMRAAADHGELPSSAPTGSDIRVAVPQPGYSPW